MTNLVEFPAGGALKQRVAEEVRVLMTRQRVKQSDIAAVLRVRQPAVSQRLNGHVDFTVTELELLASYFGVTVAQLFGATGPNFDPGPGTAQQVTGRYPLTLAA